MLRMNATTKPRVDYRPTWLEFTEKDLKVLGTASIVDIGAENIYVIKSGKQYFFKPGNTDKFHLGSFDFTNPALFQDCSISA